MPDYTGNLNLAKPIPNEDSADIRVINENMDKIDEWSRNIEPAFEKKSGFNKNKSDETNLKDSETLATSMAVAKTMEKAEEALNSAGGKEPAFNKNTAFNKNFGTGQNEILEGSKLAEILGIEYGGVLNNTNTKVAGKGYYDTANKKIYKCTTNTSINYADAGYFIEVSNNDLLGKLQNLSGYKKNLYINVIQCSATFFRVGKTILCYGTANKDYTQSGIPHEFIPRENIELYIDTNQEDADIFLGAAIKINMNGIIEFPQTKKKTEFCLFYEAKN
ncbi:MAG: hypothetical protein ACRC1Y_05940 [Paraclostridium sp.]